MEPFSETDTKCFHHQQRQTEWRLLLLQVLVKQYHNNRARATCRWNCCRESSEHNTLRRELCNQISGTTLQANCLSHFFYLLFAFIGVQPKMSRVRRRRRNRHTHRRVSRMRHRHNHVQPEWTPFIGKGLQTRIYREEYQRWTSQHKLLYQRILWTTWGYFRPSACCTSRRRIKVHYGQHQLSLHRELAATSSVCLWKAQQRLTSMGESLWCWSPHRPQQLHFLWWFGVVIKVIWRREVLFVLATTSLSCFRTMTQFSFFMHKTPQLFWGIPWTLQRRGCCGKEIQILFWS